MTVYKNKDIKTLLQLMLDKQDRFISGLCHWAAMIEMTHEEYMSLKMYISKNRPSMFSSTDAFLHCTDCYYWKVGDINPRLKWINKHIQKLSK